MQEPYWCVVNSKKWGRHPACQAERHSQSASWELTQNPQAGSLRHNPQAGSLRHILPTPKLRLEDALVASWSYFDVRNHSFPK